MEKGLVIIKAKLKIRKYYTGNPTSVPEDTTSRRAETFIHFIQRDGADQTQFEDRVAVISTVHPPEDSEGTDSPSSKLLQKDRLYLSSFFILPFRRKTTKKNKCF